MFGIGWGAWVLSCPMLPDEPPGKGAGSSPAGEQGGKGSSIGRAPKLPAGGKPRVLGLYGVWRGTN